MEQMKIAVAWLLRISVMIALFLVMTGGCWYLWDHGHELIHYSVFQERPTTPPEWSTTLIQWGILVLIVAQVVRIALVAWHFLRIKDYKFVMISGFVLVAVLFVSTDLF